MSTEEPAPIIVEVVRAQEEGGPPSSRERRDPNTCPRCSSHYRDDELSAQLRVCRTCDYHFIVGALERIKGFDTLVEAWRTVAARLPEAKLRLVGSGRLAPLATDLVASFPGRVEWHELLPAHDVAQAMDLSWLLVLPSRSEGLGRVLLEAACRGRALVGANRGGIPDVVRPGENGLLVEPGDARALAEALVAVLSDRAEAERLGLAARRTGDEWRTTPAQYAEHVEALVQRVLAG